MKFARPLLVAAAALAPVQGAAYGAGAKAKDNDPGFNAHDMNHDGIVSKSEAKANPYLYKKFATADSDHNGELSRTEYLAVMTKKDLGAVKDKVSHAFGSKESSSSAGGSSSSHTK